MGPVVDPKAPALPISISSSDNEHSDDFAHTPLQHVKGVKIVHSVGQAHDSGTSLEDTNMVRFKNLKK